jgi:cell division septum initiation protein DivIVA
MAEPELWQSELENLLDRLEALMTEGRRIPLTGYVLVETEPARALIEHMRRVMPEDVRRARVIVAEQSRLLEEARQAAARTLSGAEQQVRELAGESAVLREAERRAREVLDQAERTAREMREAARVYVDELLAGVEAELTQVTTRIRENRAELRR